MVDKRRKLSFEIIQYIKENASSPLFETYIHNCVKASEAPSFGLSVLEYAPKSKCAQDYIKLSEEILNQIMEVNHG